MKFIPIIIILLIFIIFGDRCLRGIIITFKKNLLLSILLIIFFIPAYLFWVLYEAYKLNNKKENNIIEAEYEMIEEDEE